MVWDTQTTTFDGRLKGVDRAAANIKRRSISLRTASEAGPVDYFAIDEFLTNLRSTRDELDAAAAVPGFKGWVIGQRAGDESKVTADFLAMRGAIVALIDWMVPQLNAQSNLATYDADGTKVGQEFGSAALATFRTLMSALEATINIG